MRLANWLTMVMSEINARIIRGTMEMINKRFLIERYLNNETGLFIALIID